jgi:hypothetical protein
VSPFFSIRFLSGFDRSRRFLFDTYSFLLTSLFGLDCASAVLCSYTTVLLCVFLFLFFLFACSKLASWGGWAGWFLVSALFYIQGSLLFVLFCFSHCLGTASIRKIASCFHIFDGFGFGKKVSCYAYLVTCGGPFFT